MAFNGSFYNSLDEKGRVSVPAKLREVFSTSSFVLTKNYEKSLLLYPPDKWPGFENLIESQAKTLDLKKANILRHQFIIPSTEVEIDKAGRIAIPQALRDYAGLKKDCVFLKNGNMIELWDTARYDAYLEQNVEDLEDILSNLGPIDFNQSGASNGETE
ncbi:MAG: division/cell wall cluster transcriptional repressor MraZ [Spirochaetaceae bacterium]|jgi:MraZ protein|nr:division/cell wall cluster transcriptional repressor MraZ [Spirochaetaceae bacterium]